VVRARLTVDLVQATSAGEGLHALKDQIPDLILTAPLLSPFDDGVLDEYLRDLGAAGAHVQTVRIPVLSAAPKKRALVKTLFSLARTETTSPAAPDGCDPKVFADEIALYLSRAAEARKTIAHVTQASPRQEEAPPAPPSPVIADTEVNEALIEEFSDAIDLSYTDVVEPPRYVAAAEPPRYVAAAEPWHDLVNEPSHVEEIESSRVDDTPWTAPPILETMPEAEPVTPEPDPTVPRTSATFEAALAAIRAAWVKPDEPATGASSATAATPRSASQGEVALTNTIDRLEDVGGLDRHDSEADNYSSPDSPSTPPGQHKADTPKTRPEKARGRKMEASEGRLRQDQWGVFDPGQRGLSALVDKLDEVADAEEAPKRTVVTGRIFSIG
jgi:hypothetical protein